MSGTVPSAPKGSVEELLSKEYARGRQAGLRIARSIRWNIEAPTKHRGAVVADRAIFADLLGDLIRD